MKTTFQYGNTGVTMTSDLEGYFKRLIADVKQETVGVLLGAMETIATDAEAAMPVKTGKLRDSIGTHVRVGEDSVRVGIHVGTSDTDYAYYVKFGKSSPKAGKSVYQTLIGTPVRAKAKELAKQIANRIDKVT